MEEFSMREVSNYVLRHNDTVLKLDCVSREILNINQEGVITLTLWVPILPFDFMRQLAISNEHDLFNQWIVTKETIVRVLSCGADIGHDLQIASAKISLTHDSQWQGNQAPVSVIVIQGNIIDEKLDEEQLKEINNKNESNL